MPLRAIRQLLRSEASAPAGGEGAAVATAAPTAAGTVAGPLAEARRLADDGRYREAVDLLRDAVGSGGDGELESELVVMRNRAAVRTAAEAGLDRWPPTYADPFPDLRGAPPEIEADQLDTEVLGGAILHHGCLIVRGLFDGDQVDRARDGIDRAFAGRERFLVDKHTDRWYQPLRKLDDGDNAHNAALRGMVHSQGGVWMADSPATAAYLLSQLEETGVIGSVSGYLGERPHISLQKSTLRRSGTDYRVVSWHQDGAFLDDDVRTVNVWVALSDCGGERPTPGLEIIPRRVDEVIESDGGELAANSLSGWTAFLLQDGAPATCPEFDAGDAILFDERFVHRTHLTETMTDRRWALECWMFAPSHLARSYDSLMV